MMFFVSKINTWNSVNHKGVEVQEWLGSFAHHLLPNELSKDALIETIRVKLQDFDRKHPRTIPLVMSKVHIDTKTPLYFSIYPKGHSDKPVASFYIHKVVGEYRFNEVNYPRLEKGGMK
ncbi:MAG: hypothetical protein E7097_05680 [Bacteroides sp.]|nr:hypothetical protein [Bacteroides sp.]